MKITCSFMIINCEVQKYNGLSAKCEPQVLLPITYTSRCPKATFQIFVSRLRIKSSKTNSKNDNDEPIVFFYKGNLNVEEQDTSTDQAGCYRVC